MKKQFLLAPGPTPVPEEVLLAMAEPMYHHRTPRFSKVVEAVKEDLKLVFKTQNDVLILASSGTGAMDGTITNLFSPGDKILVINAGKFGERWGKIGQSYGLDVIWLEVPWGKAVNPAEVAEKLKNEPGIKGVFVQACETSTAVGHPIKELAEIVRKYENILLVVDGITAVGVYDLPMDDWGIDVLISGSQKAFMLPPGLAFVALSDKAWKFSETARLPKFYFDFKKEKKNLAKNTTAYTPAISLIIGLKKALEMMKAEGMEKVYARHHRLARATRAGLTALGLKLFAPEAPGESATAVCVPESIEGEKLLKSLRDDFGVTLAGGQDELKGKILRITHMGYADTFDIVIAISAIEMALTKFNYPVELGKGVAAAQKILLEGY